MKNNLNICCDAYFDFDKNEIILFKQENFIWYQQQCPTFKIVIDSDFTYYQNMVECYRKMFSKHSQIIKLDKLINSLSQQIETEVIKLKLSI